MTDCSDRGQPEKKESLCTYQLLIRLTVPRRIQIGRLGTFSFPAGYYVYTGRARRYLEARLARHLSRIKNLHWHIDYLIAARGVRVTGVCRLRESECTAAQRLNGLIVVPGFGASDCRAGCGSHLKYLGPSASPLSCGVHDPEEWAIRFDPTGCARSHGEDP